MDRVRDRLRPLSARLGGADWLDGAFSAGDLMMVSVLLRLKPSGILDEYQNLAAQNLVAQNLVAQNLVAQNLVAQNLAAYVGRGEARPAYQRAFAAQLAVNSG